METIDDIVYEVRGNAEHNHALVEVSKYLNEIADRIEAVHRRETEKLRALVDGLIEAATIECASCNYDCGMNRENCIIKQATDYLEGCAE